MKLRPLVLGSLTVLLLAVMTPPASAVCGAGSGALYSGYSPIHSNPAWPGGSYCAGCGPALSGNHDGVFWHLGFGDPLPRVGDDNGTWAAANWLRTRFVDFPPYYFDGHFTGGGWGGDLAVDGCILFTDFDGCTCVALGDEYPGENLGRFASMSSRFNVNSSFAAFDFRQPLGCAPLECDPLTLVPMPTPIVESIQEFGNGSVDVTVRVDPPSDGNYVGFEGCDCAAVGYQIRAVQNPDGVATVDVPGTRAKSAWPLLPLGDGSGNDAGDQTATDLGDSVTVHATCSDVNPIDLYLVTELFFPNGDGPLFTIEYVSGDSAVVECGLVDDVPATGEWGLIGLFAMLLVVTAVALRRSTTNVGG